MSPNSLRSDCRKFAPNIFNKTKCSNCFKQKEEHTAEALECNRAMRKVAKSGYLFVAPGWDFSIPLNRTKRWQRRWFVLYDDGELNYSVDEHPDTVPQASIDMTQVLEVAGAEEVTGHAFSLAITAPDRVTFVKGMARDEARAWTNVLAVYTRNKGRHKRNATFPGGQTTTIHQTQALPRSGTPNPIRPRYNSCHSDSVLRPSTRWNQETSPQISTPITTSISTPVSIPSPTSTSSNSNTNTTITPSANVTSTIRQPGSNNGYRDQPASSASPPTRDKLNSEEKAAVRTRSRLNQQQHHQVSSPTKSTSSNSETSSIDPPTRIIPDYENQTKRAETLKDIAAELTRPRALSSPVSNIGQAPTRDSDSTDDTAVLPTSPDVVDSGNAELRVELPAEGLLHLKKGWLMLQVSGAWTKLWFVLCGGSLSAYRDPGAEDAAAPDLVVSLASLAGVTEVHVQRNYGFQLRLWNDIVHTLSAVTAGIRGNWIGALRKAASLDELPPAPPPRPLSSDEEYKTASEGGRRGSGDWTLPPSPPLARTAISKVKERARSRSSSRTRLYKRSRSSPPSSRASTLDSVSTEELLAACCAVAEPDTELSDAAVVELLETEVAALRVRMDQYERQDDELRRKLRNAANDLSTAEAETARLRAEATARERRMQQLLGTLQRTERQLEDVDALRLLHQNDKKLWEAKLKDKEDHLKQTLEKYELLNRDFLSKQMTNESLQEEMSCLNDRLIRGIEENDYLYKKVQELEGKGLKEHTSSSFGSLSDLTNIDLDLDFNNITKDTLMDEYNNVKFRFEKAVQEIRAMKRELRNSHIKFDDLELQNITLQQDIKRFEEENEAQNTLMAARIQDLTTKLTASEKQVRNLKSKLQDSREKRRSLSLKGRESFSINKEVEDKITELEAKILALETDKLNGAINKRLLKPTKKIIKRDRSSERASPVDERSQRRLRRKSLDSATTSEPMKVLIRLSSLESKVSSICDVKSPTRDDNLATSTESLNFSNQELKPVTESESNSKILALESTVEAAIQKLNDCTDQISILKHARRQISPLSDRLAPLEQTLTELSNILKVSNSVSSAEVDVISESVLTVVKSFEKLLKEKLIELSNKRRTLRESGKLTTQNNLNILAEKLAYEAVLISRIHDALNTPQNDGSRFSCRILRREVLETGQLAQLLQSKLSGTQAKKSCSSKLSEEHLTRVLTRKLIQVGFVTNNNRHITTQEQQNKRDVNKGLEYLLSKQKEINLLLQRYKSAKLEQLAYNLALETLNYASDTDCRLDKQNLHDLQVKEAWKTAQETVSSELIQSEISHVMLRCAQSYEHNISSNHSAFFTFFASERAALELWADTVEKHLRTEMENNIEELTTAYKTSLAKLRQQSSGIWRRRVEQERNANKSRQLLSEFADIIAHKALVDSRITVLTGNTKFTNSFDKSQNIFVKNLVESEQYLSIMEDCGVLESEPILDSEFQYLFQRFRKQCENELNSGEKDLQNVSEALNNVERDLDRLQAALLPTSSTQSTEISLNNWTDVCAKCGELQRRLSALIATTGPCTHCQHLRDSLNRLSREHEAEVAVLRRDQEREQHEQAQLRERARQLEQRLGTLDSEYAAQLEQLRSAYRDTLSPTEGEEGGLRARYQAEIEQLRALCEKGLAAVESSHRRVVAELQDKHRKEREQLRLEKEQALAEETQATLAALDAMRKAHEHEVRREIGKFKADFLRKLQATHDLGALHQEHEAEMREIKAEILSLSERYSVKCVESASLEEQLCSVHQQLAQAHHHIQQLDNRNKQLRKHLVAELSSESDSTNDQASVSLSFRQDRVNITTTGWLVLVLILCVSTFGASCVVAIILGFVAFIIGLLTLLYVQSGNFEDTYISYNLLNNPLVVQEAPVGGLFKVVQCVKQPKSTQKTDQRVTGSDLIDSSLQEIFGYIIRDYIQPWYSLISSDSEFLENGVRKSAQTLAIHISNRVKEIDWLPYLTTRLVDDAATQLRLFRGARLQLTADGAMPRAGSSPKHRRNKSDTDVTAGWQQQQQQQQQSLEQYFFSLEAEAGSGRAGVCTDTVREAHFLAALSELLLYVLLPDADFRCSAVRIILRELTARCLLRPFVDLLADPDTINQAVLWICVRDGTISTDAFLAALRLTDDAGELRHTRDLVTRELQQLRNRDAAAGDVKQKLGSLNYLARLLDARLSKLQHREPPSQPMPPPNVHLPLQALLTNNVALSYFIDYVVSVGQQAYLYFYLNVEGWKVTAEQQLGNKIGVDRLRETAKHIFQQYLAENSPQQMHIPSPLIHALYSKIHDPTYPPSHRWFDEVQRHIYEKMRTEDIFVAGFERSAGYIRLLADLEIVGQLAPDEDEEIEVNPRPSIAKHARSFSDTTDTKSNAAVANMSLKSESQQLLSPPIQNFGSLASVNDTEEDYAKLKVGNFTLSVDIIEAGVMSEKGKTFGIYATQVSKLYDSGFLEQWHIYRRYSDFHDLQARVRERWPDLARLPFPGKKPFHNMERTVLERRMRMLNAYMAALCRRTVLDSHVGLRVILQSFTEQAEYDRATAPSGPIASLRSAISTVDEMVGKVFHIKTEREIPPSISTLDDDNIPLRVLLVLVDEVFDLRSRNQWLRRRLVTLLRQIVRAWFGDIVSRRIVEYVAGSTSPKNVAKGIRSLQHAVWPGGIRAPRPIRPPAVRSRTRVAAKVALLTALSDDLKHLLGSETTRSGLLTVFELFQRPTLTRRLIYVLLEGALAHLMPEKPVPQLFRQLYDVHCNS